MARRGITQVAIAEQLGITQQAVSGKLTGRSPFSLEQLTKVAHLLGVHPAELLDGRLERSAS